MLRDKLNVLGQVGKLNEERCWRDMHAAELAEGSREIPCMWVRKCQEAEVSNDCVGLPDRPAGAIQFNGYLFERVLCPYWRTEEDTNIGKGRTLPLVKFNVFQGTAMLYLRRF